MKHYLLLLSFVFLLAGCAKAPYVSNTYFTDYRTFTDKKFFITESDAVSFDYDAIGHIEVEVQSGYEFKGNASNKSNGLMEKKWGKFIQADINKVMDEFYQKATDKGANGALKLNITSIVSRMQIGGITQDVIIGYRISGMLIKIR